MRVFASLPRYFNISADKARSKVASVSNRNVCIAYVMRLYYITKQRMKERRTCSIAFGFQVVWLCLLYCVSGSQRQNPVFISVEHDALAFSFASDRIEMLAKPVAPNPE